MVGCATCTPTADDFERDFPREDIHGNSRHGLSLCMCPACRQLFARYWIEAVNWCDGDDKIHHFWVPVTTTQAEALRRKPSIIRQLILLTPHWAQEPDGLYVHRPALLSLVQGARPGEQVAR